MAPRLEPELNRGRPRDHAYEMHLLTWVRRSSGADDSRSNVGGGAACAWDPEPSRRVHARVGFRFVSPRRGVEHCGSAARGARPCPRPRWQPAAEWPTTMLPPASNRPSSAASACSAPSCASPQRCRQRALTRPDRTPDSLRGARQRDPGGCGTARATEPAKPARLRRPQTWPAATRCRLGRPGTPLATRAQ